MRRINRDVHVARVVEVNAYIFRCVTTSGSEDGE